MADLKLGSQIGGNLIWHQGVLELNPQETQLFYKTQEIITDRGGQSINGDLSATNNILANRLIGVGSDVSWGLDPRGAFSRLGDNTTGAHWLLTSNKANGNIRAGIQILTNDTGTTRLYTNSGASYVEFAGGQVTLTASTPTIAGHVTRKDYVDREVTRAMDYTDTRSNAADAAISTLNTRVTTLDAQNVKLTGNQSIAGVKSFTSFPVVPTTPPTADNQLTSKKYVDDQIGITVKSVSATAPLLSSGGLTPTISITPSSRIGAGSMSAADKVKLDDLPADALSRSGGTMSGLITMTGAIGINYTFGGVDYAALRHHGNGNVTVGAAGGTLYLGYDVAGTPLYTTQSVSLHKKLYWQNNLSRLIVDDDGFVPWAVIKDTAGLVSRSAKLTGAIVFDNYNLTASYNLYNTQTGSTNSPPFAYGTLSVIGSGTDGNTFVTQVATDRSNGAVYIRTRTDGVMSWTPWRKQLNETGGSVSGTIDANTFYTKTSIAVSSLNEPKQALFFGIGADKRTILGGAGGDLMIRPNGYGDLIGQTVFGASGSVAFSGNISTIGFVLNGVEPFNSFNNIFLAGQTNNAMTTAQFITRITELGAFNNKVWINKCPWNYAGNSVITDTGVGNIHLAGCIVEVNSIDNTYIIRITTPTTAGTPLGAITSACFTYVNNGPSYSPGWRRDYNTTNRPSNADVGLSNYKNVSDAAYGSVTITGKKSGYAGIHFGDFNRVLMIQGTVSGVYKSDTSAWQWYFDNNTLVEGIIPWARIPDAPATATRWPNAGEVGAVSKIGDNMTGLLSMSINSASSKMISLDNTSAGWTYMQFGNPNVVANSGHFAWKTTAEGNSDANSFHIRPGSGTTSLSASTSSVISHVLLKSLSDITVVNSAPYIEFHKPGAIAFKTHIDSNNEYVFSQTNGSGGVVGVGKIQAYNNSLGYWWFNAQQWSDVNPHAYNLQSGRDAPLTVNLGVGTGAGDYYPIIRGKQQMTSYGYRTQVDFGILRSSNAAFGGAVIRVASDESSAHPSYNYVFDINGNIHASRLVGRADVATTADSAPNYLPLTGGNLSGDLTVNNITTGDITSNSWLRTVGNGGVFFGTHGGGWNMTDTTWITAYGVGRKVYIPTVAFDSLQVGGGIVLANGATANTGCGLTGGYDATKFQGVFAMGYQYRLPENGVGTANHYGIAWTHSNNTNANARKVSGHHMVIQSVGTTKVALGDGGIWSAGSIKTDSDIACSNINVSSTVAAVFLRGDGGQITNLKWYNIAGKPPEASSWFNLLKLNAGSCVSEYALPPQLLNHLTSGGVAIVRVYLNRSNAANSERLARDFIIDGSDGWTGAQSQVIIDMGWSGISSCYMRNNHANNPANGRNKIFSQYSNIQRIDIQLL